MPDYDYEDLPVAKLPNELFRQILKCLPESQVAGLRLVCRTWKELVDSDSWLTRVLFWKPTTECLHKPVSQLPSKIAEVADRLRYLDLDIGENEAELMRDFKFPRLKTLILRSVADNRLLFYKFCPHLPDIGLTSLKLVRLDWRQLETLHHVLPKCSSLHTLELYMPPPDEYEQEMISDLLDDHTRSDCGNFEQYRDPDYHLPQLHKLVYNWELKDTQFDIWPGAEYDLYSKLHRHLVKILLAATQISDLALCGGFSADCNRSLLVGDVENYRYMLPELGKTHKLLKRASFDGVSIQSWMIDYLEEMTVSGLLPRGLPSDVLPWSMSDSAMRRLEFRWIFSNPSLGPHYLPRDIPFSSKMIEYRTSHGPGTGVAGFLKILRKLTLPIKTMKILSLEAVHDKNRSQPDFFDDTDIRLIITYLPCLESVTIVDYLRCRDDPESILRAGLPELHHLKIVRLD